MTASDLVVIADSTWTGCISGGYYPIRLRISNRGPECTVTARFIGSETETSRAMPTTTKTVSVSQNETAQFTLLIPQVSRGTTGRLYIEKNNRRFQKLSTTLAFEYAIGEMYNSDVPAMLILDENRLDLTDYTNAVNRIFHGQHASSVGSVGSSGLPNNAQLIAPDLLPDTWLAYSGIDIVALSLKTLLAMSADNRSALLQWVETGGNLMIYDVGAEAPEPESMTRLLQLKQRNSVGQGWSDMDSYALRPFLQGQIISIPFNPFPITSKTNAYTESDWQQLLNSRARDKSVLSRRDISWGVRHGVRPRSGHTEFFRFLIPGIRGVPAFSFITLITIFALAIGPVNYFFFWKQKQLGMLVITIPLIAFTTSLCLFGYSAIAHGFGLKSRVRSLTVVDQGSNTAVTTSRMAIFAGATPSRGLQYSPQTAIYPLWPGSNGFEAGEVDWTDKQVLTGGWLRSRTRTQFVTVSHQAQRGRLDVRRKDEFTLTVDNGFETDLDCLVVTDDQGRHYYSSRVPAGASADMNLLTADNKRELTKRLNDFPMKIPEALNKSGRNFYGNRNSMRAAYNGASNTLPVGYSNSAAEIAVTQFELDLSGESNRKKTYLAIFRENPGIDTGYRYAAEKASRHCLIGYY